VSWIIPPLAECEHPAAPPEYGEYLARQILNTLVSNPGLDGGENVSSWLCPLAVAKPARWPSQNVTGLPGPLRRHRCRSPNTGSAQRAWGCWSRRAD
jgi:hypothetical protein